VKAEICRKILEQMCFPGFFSLITFAFDFCSVFWSIEEAFFKICKSFEQKRPFVNICQLTFVRVIKIK
jgi:hypothetical protein